MNFRKKILYPILILAGLFLLVFFSEHREAALLIEKYRDSEEAVRLLKTKRTFHLYQQIHKQKPMISPVDLSIALNDAKILDEKDSDFIISLAGIRHLLGTSYPTGFAAALARTESILPETASEGSVPISSPDKDKAAFFNEV